MSKLTDRGDRRHTQVSLPTLLRYIKGLARQDSHDILKAFPTHDRMRLHLAHAQTARISLSPLSLCVFPLISLALGRIAKHPALLCNALHEARAYWGVARVGVAHIVLELIQRICSVVDEEPERLAQRRERVFD